MIAVRIARCPSRFGRLLVAVLTALTLAGCFPGASTAPVIKIGVVAPFEGLGRPLGYSVLAAARAAVSDAARDGEAGPYRLLVVAQNDDGDAGTAAFQVNALAADPQVVGVIGPWSSALATSVAPVAQDLGIPLISGAATPAQDKPFVFSMCPTLDQMAEAMVAESQTGVTNTVDVAGPDDAYRHTVRARLEANGIQPTQDNPNARIDTGDAQALAEDLAAWRTAGWTGTVIAGPDAHRPWLAALAGQAANQVRVATCEMAPPASIGASADATDGVDQGLEPEARAAYTATRALLSAIAQATREGGTASRLSVASALGQAIGARRLRWWQMQDGRWVQIN